MFTSFVNNFYMFCLQYKILSCRKSVSVPYSDLCFFKWDEICCVERLSYLFYTITKTWTRPSAMSWMFANRTGSKVCHSGVTLSVVKNDCFLNPCSHVIKSFFTQSFDQVFSLRISNSQWYTNFVLREKYSQRCERICCSFCRPF